MDTENIIRIDNRDTPIYRIFPLSRIEQLFRECKLVLVNPRMWEDPFENFLLRCSAELNDGTSVSLKSLADSWFGQCWTLNSDTDAMWRIYSHDKQGIRVKTTIGKLAKAVWRCGDEFASLSYFIGRVQYHSRQEIEAFLTSTSFEDVALGGQNKNFANLLLTKRKEFEHEAEVRVLAHDSSAEHGQKLNGLYRVAVDPNELVEEICLDPRLLDEIDAECVRKKIDRTGYEGKVTQSELYKLHIDKIRFQAAP